MEDSAVGGRISIHALREEGDFRAPLYRDIINGFLSTPSARRATEAVASEQRKKQFLSTPSARRATITVPRSAPLAARFLSTPSARRATGDARNKARVKTISIHALREEGDSCQRI